MFKQSAKSRFWRKGLGFKLAGRTKIQKNRLSKGKPFDSLNHALIVADTACKFKCKTGNSSNFADVLESYNVESTLSKGLPFDKYDAQI